MKLGGRYGNSLYDATYAMLVVVVFIVAGVAALFVVFA